MKLVKIIRDTVSKYEGIISSAIQYPRESIQGLSRRKTALTAAALLTLFTAAKAKSAPTMYWDVWFQSQLTSSSKTLFDTYKAGVKEGASDGYGANDVMEPPGPPGEYIQLFSIVDGRALTCDIREVLEQSVPKTWEITQVAADPLFQGFSGTNYISWDISTVPLNTNLTLIDYGMDATRTFPVDTIDMRVQDYYSSYVNHALGPYRYMAFKGELIIPAPSSINMALLGLGGLALLMRKNSHYKKN